MPVHACAWSPSADSGRAAPPEIWTLTAGCPSGAQSVNLGAALTASGFTYAPCYVSSNPIGAFAGATGLCVPAPAAPRS